MSARRSTTDTFAPAAVIAGLLAIARRLTIVRILTQDRLLGVSTLLLTITALCPLLATPILPLVDLGSVVGATSVIADAAVDKGVIGYHFAIFWFPIPYWTAYAFMAVVSAAFGPFVAAKAIVALVVVLLPLGVMRLMFALQRSPRLGLWAFLLTWDVNLYWGWVTFQLGMALVLFVLAALIEARSKRQILWVASLSLVVGLTHLHAVALLGTVGLALTLASRPFGPALRRHALSLSGCAIVVLPFVVTRFFGTGGAETMSFASEFSSVGEKLGRLFHYSLDVLPTRDGQVWTGVAFVVVLIGPLLLSAFADQTPDRQSRRYAIAILLSCLALYFLLPFSVHGPRIQHWWTFPRFATYILIALLLIPAVDFSGRRALMLLPGVLAAVALHSGIYSQFADYGSRVGAYLEIIDALPEDCRFLPLDFDDSDPATVEKSVGQLHGYAGAAKSCYDPHLFDYNFHPMLFRRDRILPHPNWFRPREFTMERHGRYYDYIIVHPRRRDPLYGRQDAGHPVELMRESGEWRLYRVVNAPPKPY